MFKRKADLFEQLGEYEKTARHSELQLRLDLADLIIRRLRETGDTQKELAQRAGMKESFVSRLIHGDSNYTCLVAARVLFALGVRPKLVDAGEWEALQATTKPASTGQGSVIHAKFASTGDIIPVPHGVFRTDAAANREHPEQAGTSSALVRFDVTGSPNGSARGDAAFLLCDSTG